MPELRKDPVLNRWVIISTERGLRPNEFDGGEGPGEEYKATESPFAEGNEGFTPPEILAVRKPDSAPNGPGWSIRVVPNKFPALRIEGDLDPRGYGLYDRMNGVGAHEVIVECPSADDRLSGLPLAHIAELVKVYKDRVDDLCRDKRFAYVLVFKNHGEEAGASLRHEHSQIIATPMVPNRVIEELQGAREHWKRKRRSIFLDIIDQELMFRDRVVFENDHMLAFCPYASASPFEIHIYPKRHNPDFRKATVEEAGALAEALKACLLKWKGALGEVPYNYLIHTAPNEGSFDGIRSDFPYLDAYYHWHLEMFPRLGKAAGFEWGTGFYINSTPPEEAAEFLRGIKVDLARCG